MENKIFTPLNISPDQSPPVSSPRSFNFFRRPILWIPAVIVLITVIFLFIWKFKQSSSEMSGAFSLKAESADDAGIMPRSAFILTTEKDYSPEQVKQFLNFSPSVEYSVEKVKKLNIASNNNKTSKQSYMIRPSEPLEEGQLYQAVINNEEYADREFSWAFQVKAPFQVVSVFPRHEGTHVPLNSGIEITYNRSGLVNPEKYFSISPNVEGSFETHYDTLIFKPKSLQPKTVYTITLKKGLRSTVTDETVDKDMTFMFETESDSIDPFSNRYNSFYYSEDWMEYSPGKKPVVRIWTDTEIDFSEVEIGLYKLESAEEFVNSYLSARQWNLRWSMYQGKGYKYVPPENKKILSFKPEVVKDPYDYKFFEVPQEIGPGYYVLFSRYREEIQEMWLQINPLAHYLSITAENSLLWLYDFKNRQPAPEGGISLIKEGGKETKLADTSKDGLATFKTPEEISGDNGECDVGMCQTRINFFKVSSRGSLPKIIKVWGEANQGKDYWSYISIDRPVYQMSDTLRFWGIVKGRNENLREKKVTVAIRNSDFYYSSEKRNIENLYSEKKISVSPYDTITGEIDFKGFSPGFYVLEVSYGEEILSTVYFEVKTYTKPAYQIKVTADKDRLYAGSEVKFRIKASFFDGTPVSGLVLNGNLLSLTNDKEIKLDANGEAVFSYIPGFDNDSKSTYYFLNFVVTPKFSEEGDIRAGGGAMVFGPDLYLQAYNSKNVGDKITVIAKLNSIVLNDQKNGESEKDGFRYDYIGDPVRNYPLEAQLIKITNVKEEDGEYYDYIDKVTRKTYRYSTVEEVVESFSGFTNSQGEWIIQKELPRIEDVSYKIKISGTAKNGRKIEDTAYIYSYNPYRYKERTENLKVSLNVNEKTKDYRFGDKVSLAVNVVEGNLPEKSPVLFYRYRNSFDKITAGTALSLEETFDESFLPASKYKAVVLGPYGFLETDSVLVSLNTEERRLKVEINTDKSAYRPKEKIKVNFRVTDKNNQPTKSEINASAVDEAVFQVSDFYYTEDILEKLYQFSGPDPISDLTDYAPVTEGEMGGCFLEGTRITLANGKTKPIEEIKVGDVIATLANDRSKKLVTAVVQGTSRHFVNEYLIINEKLKVTGEHRLMINGKWIEAKEALVGDSLTTENGASELIKKIEIKSGNDIPVHNIIVGKYHTYLADGYFVHNEEKGGSTRSNFQDTALFQSVATNNQGEAEIEFIAPDNITSWRLTARAFAPEKIMAGESSRSIKTSLPFFVESTISAIYLENDEPFVKLRVFGDDYKPGEKVSFNIKSESLGLNESRETDTNNVVVPLGRMKEGEHSLLISAKQGNNSDSLIRKITVLKSYVRSTTFKSYSLEGQLDKIAGNPNGMTTLVFSDKGKNRFLPSLQSISSSNGIRADQLVARYLGQETLNSEFAYEIKNDSLDLERYYTENKAIGLFPYYGSDDIELSAKIADAAEKFVDKAKLSKYFHEVLHSQNSDLHQSIKALYGLACIRTPILDKISLVKNKSSELNLEDKIYLALAMAKIGNKEEARDFYFREIRDKIKFKGDEGWTEVKNDKTRSVKLTATLSYLQSLIDAWKDFDSVWNYLERNYPQRDLDLLERAMTAANATKKIREVGGEITIESSLRKEKIKIENGVAVRLTVSAQELPSLKITNVKGSIGLTSYYETTTNPNDLKKDEKINVTRSFENAADKSNNLKEGDMVRIIISPKISEMATDGSYQIIDFLPSGLRPAMQIYHPGINTREDGPCRPVWYPSRIENNIVYFNIDKNFERSNNCQNRSIVYFARIVSSGTYKADNAIIQSLANPAIINYSAPDQVQIK